jgi:thiol-disulfide isomerase/thioredoxin
MADTATSSDSTAASGAGSGAAVSPSADRAHTARMMLVVAALAAGFAIVPRVSQGCGKAAANEDAPDFTASLVANAASVPDSTEPSLTMSKLRGHPVILDFWATWCGPCQAQSPIVNGISQLFKD